MARHLVGAEDGEHRLRREQRLEPLKHVVVERRAQAAGAGGVDLDPAVVEQDGELGRAEVEERLRIARHPLQRRVGGVGDAVGAEADAAVAERERQAVAGAEGGVVAGGAGDFLVARQDRIVEQELPEAGGGLVHRAIVGVGDGGGPAGRVLRPERSGEHGGEQGEGERRADHGATLGGNGGSGNVNHHAISASVTTGNATRKATRIRSEATNHRTAR